LVNSRLTPTLTGVKTPFVYLGVADMETNQSLEVNEFMVGYKDLRSIKDAYTAGTPLSDLGITDFNELQT